MPLRMDLTTRFENSWKEWSEANLGLDDAGYKGLVYPKWSVKDILGHVFSYMDLDVRHVRSYQKRHKLASPRAPSYSYFNRREAARLRPVPAAQLCTDLESRYRELMALLPTLTGEDMKKKFPSQWSNSKYTTSLRALLREEATHLHQHAADIRKWRDGQHDAE